MTSLLDGLLSALVGESSAEVPFSNAAAPSSPSPSTPPTPTIETTLLTDEPLENYAGASLIQTRRLIQSKINANHRRLAKRTEYIFDHWPEVAVQIDREQKAIRYFNEEVKCLPRLARSIGTIQVNVCSIIERAIALEELLISLETLDAQHRKDKWKQQQNAELRDYQIKLQRTLNHHNSTFDDEMTQKQTEATQMKTQWRQEEAKASLYRTKLMNVLKGIEEKETYFASIQYLNARSARDEFFQQQKTKKAFEDALQRDMADYLRDPAAVLPPKRNLDDKGEEAVGDVVVMVATPELEAFLDEGVEKRSNENGSVLRKPDEESGGLVAVRALKVELEPEDPELGL